MRIPRFPLVIAGDLIVFLVLHGASFSHHASSGAVPSESPVSVEAKQVWKREDLKDLMSVLAFSPDAKLLASGNNRDGLVKLFDAANGELRLTLPGVEANEMVSGLCFHPTEPLLACTSYESGRINVWSIKEKLRKATLSAHAGRCIAFAFSPDGKWIASLGEEAEATVSL